MNKCANEEWDYYSYCPENITLNGLEYAVKLRGGKDDGSDDRAVTNSEDVARLIAAAPEMYRLLEGAANFLELKSKYNVSFEGYAGIIREILAHIDGEQEVNHE